MIFPLACMIMGNQLLLHEKPPVCFSLNLKEKEILEKNKINK